MIVIDASPDRVVRIGRNGENAARQVRFKIDRFTEDLPGGNYEVLFQRSGDASCIELDNFTVDEANKVLLWTITSAITDKTGYAELQIVCSKGQKRASSDIYRIEVCKSLA